MFYSRSPFELLVFTPKQNTVIYGNDYVLVLRNFIWPSVLIGPRRKKERPNGQGCTEASIPLRQAKREVIGAQQARMLERSKHGLQKQNCHAPLSFTSQTLKSFVFYSLQQHSLIHSSHNAIFASRCIALHGSGEPKMLTLIQKVLPCEMPKAGKVLSHKSRRLGPTYAC